MKKYLYLIIAACLISCDRDPDFNFRPLLGKGPIETYSRNPGNYTGIELQTDAEVYIDSVNRNTISIEGQKNICDNLKFSINGPILTIDNIRPVFNGKMVKIHIGNNRMNEIKIKGSGCIKITGKYKVSDLLLGIDGSGDIFFESLDAINCKSDITGSGNINLNGSAEKQSILISGSGNYYAMNLKTKESGVKISGSGNSEVWTLDKLTVDINGSGNVKYKGQPLTQFNISGSGKILHTN